MESGNVGVGPQVVAVEKLDISPGWFVGLGILLVLLGIAAIGTPVAVSVTLNIFLGILLVIGGLAQLVQAISSRQWSGFLLHILAAAVYVMTGILLLVYPLEGVVTLTILLAIYLLVSGFIKILTSLTLRSNPGWGLLLFVGLVDFILGALIWSKWPSNADWVIGLLIGINLLLSGISMIMIGVAAKVAEVDDPVQPA